METINFTSTQDEIKNQIRQDVPIIVIIVLQSQKQVKKTALSSIGRMQLLGSCGCVFKSHRADQIAQESSNVRTWDFDSQNGGSKPPS